MKRFAILLLFIFLVAVAVAVVGYVPLRLDHEGAHLLQSKTSGWTVVPNPETRFDWRWELLIPRNAKIHTFPVIQREISIRVSEKLPSADLYKTVVDGSPDFSVAFDIDIIVVPRREYLPELAAGGLRPDSYAQWFDRVESQAAVALASRIRTIAADASLLSNEDLHGRLTEDVERTLVDRFPALSFVSIVPRSFDVPDMALYALARETYRDLEEARRTALLSAAAEFALQAAAQQSRMELFHQYGEILERYPALIDYLSIVAQTGGDPLGLGDLAQIGVEQ